MDITKIDYSILDRPEILDFLFHPRSLIQKNIPSSDSPLIPVDDNVVIGARLHMTHHSVPNILFFHGNGEIVADYEDLGMLYNQHGINFIPVDYRGYGSSTGKPTITAMMRDCHLIFRYIKQRLNDTDHNGKFIVMGRSLGSASALELASFYQNQIDGLIIESGFADDIQLLQLLGINLNTMGLNETTVFKNIEKIATFKKPALIIHAEYDHIIPFKDGQALYNACPSKDKELLKIPGADHNNIFQVGLPEYLKAIEILINKL